MADDRELAEQLATHRYDHAERVDDCAVCREVMRHVDTWFRSVLRRVSGTDHDTPADVGATVTCPRCGMTSWHREDVRYGYCGNCHDFTSVPRG